LSRGCCCTKAVVEALTICVSGSEKDANPSENSERVRAQAEMALMHCLSCMPVKAEGNGEKSPEKSPETPPEKPQAGNTSSDGVQLTAFHQKHRPRPTPQVMEEAGRALDAAAARPVMTASLPTGSRSLADIGARASASPAQETVPAEVVSSEPVPAKPSPAPV